MVCPHWFPSSLQKEKDKQLPKLLFWLQSSFFPYQLWQLLVCRYYLPTHVLLHLLYSIQSPFLHEIMYIYNSIFRPINQIALHSISLWKHCQDIIYNIFTVFFNFICDLCIMCKYIISLYVASGKQCHLKAWCFIKYNCILHPTFLLKAICLERKKIDWPEPVYFDL